MSQLFECKCFDIIAPYLSSNSQTVVEKVVLNSLKKMVPGLLLNFSILPKELLISMVYMGVEVMACNRIYGDGVKVGAVTSVPH
jgi:predicted thioesterase